LPDGSGFESQRGHLISRFGMAVSRSWRSALKGGRFFEIPGSTIGLQVEEAEIAVLAQLVRGAAVVD
jgi:hypothetical protein